MKVHSPIRPYHLHLQYQPPLPVHSNSPYALEAARLHGEVLESPVRETAIVLVGTHRDRRIDRLSLVQLAQSER